jgi:hypothetical protein
VALLGTLGAIAFGPAPAYAATTPPMVTLSGQLIQLADQTGPAVAAIQTADKQLVPVEPTAVKNLKAGSAVTLDVAVPAEVRSAAAANRTLTERGPNGRSTSTPLDTQDLAKASDGTPEPATSDLGRATAASAVSTGQALVVSAVVSAAAPVGSYAPAPRHLIVAIVTPKDWPATNTVTSDQIQTQVAGASNYWSTVSVGAVTLDVATITASYPSAFTCADPTSMFSEAVARTGFVFAPNTSLVVELPSGVPGCSYGLGKIGANVNDWGELYVSDDVFPVLAHELGHNMSLEHANALHCPSASDSAFIGTNWTGSGCTEAPYGDSDDVMSASRRDYAPFLSSPQSLRTGLIPAVAAQVISTNGTTNVTLNALGGLKGLRAAEVVDPTNGVTYYVEYRVATVPDTPNLFGDALGVRILRFNPVSGTTVVLDPTPTGTGSADKDATLRVGATFTSYSGTVTVTTKSTTTTMATLSITRGAASFTPLPTARVFDGTAGTSPRLVQVAGLGGVPANATSVVVNTEVFNPSAAGYVRVTSAGLDAGVAVQEFGRGQTISNLVVVKLVGGKVQVKVSAGSARILMDVSGYYSVGAGASFAPLPTARVFDGTATTAPRLVQIAGLGGVPASATAVMVNVEVFNPSAAGYVRVTPAGLNPGVAVQEFARGQTISNLVAVQLVGGRVQVKVSAGSARVLMDVSGYYSAGAGSSFTALPTARVFDGTATTAPRLVQIAGLGGVPANATSVVVNVEVFNPSAAGYVRVTPAGLNPGVAVQEFARGQAISNLVAVQLVGGRVQLKVSAGSARVLMDISGYYAPAGP